MKTIQISCNSKNWNESDITIIGLIRNGRKSLPQTIKPTELEQSLLAIWEGLVNRLKTIAPNEWAASFIECHLVTNEETNEEEIKLTIFRQWDDNTTAEPLTMTMTGEAVQFFKTLTQTTK